VQINEVSFQHSAMERFIVVLFSFSLLIDSINGFLTLKLGLPSIISIAYKQAILLCLYLYCLRFSKQAFIALNGILFCFFLWACLRYFMVDNLAFAHSFQEALKAVYFLIVFVTISHFKTLTSKHFHYVCWIFLATVLINILLSLVGIGLNSYGSYGAKGFFYGGNVLSGIMVIVSSYFFASAIRHSVMRFLAVVALMTVVAIIIGTKSGILGIFLCALFITALNLNTKIFVIIVMMFLLLLGAVLFVLEDISQSPIVGRMIFFYEQGGLDRLIFSGREEKFATIIPEFFNRPIQEIFFGFDNVQLNKLIHTATEFDLVDMVIYFGVLFSAIMTLAYSYIFFKLTKATSMVHRQSVIVSFLVLGSVAFIAGHVFFNGTITPIWGFVCGAAMSINSNKSDAKLS